MRVLALLLSVTTLAVAAPEDLRPPAYQGVTPGEENLPPRAPKLPVGGPVRMTWPGFQVSEGVPRVFIELTGPIDWSVAESRGQLVYTLKQVVVPLRNNRRPLNVAEFQTAVTHVAVRPQGHNVQLVIRLRERARVAHREHLEGAAGGFKLLMIELTPEG